LILAALIVASICAASRADVAPAWQAMLGDLLKTEDAGYGGLCGIVVDPAKGTVWINISDRGFYRSDDQARTFHRCGDKQPTGRTEAPGCFQLDPTGATHRLLTALVYGSPISVSDDDGATWKSLDAKSQHIDWCAANWTDLNPKFILALKHESGGLLIASHDGGATFSEIGKGYGPGWVFDDKTAVVAEAKDRPQPNILRTTDGGATWSWCAAYAPVGSNSAQALPKWHDRSLYWLVEGALIASDDHGATWRKVSDVTGARYGPVFGIDAKHMFILTNKGVIVTTDGGATWSPPIPPPKDLDINGGLAWLAYDPGNDILYMMKMGSDLFKLAPTR
jgi:photosystem II stability/assembly factor-like uncharacterized protein